jgi:hypothetical protein
VCVLVGLPDDPEANRYRYRDGEIVFQRVLFCSVDKPENERILGHPGRIWFVVDRAKPESLPKTIANALDSDVLCYSLYILDWESEIHIAAKDVSFSWLGANSTVRSE